MKQTISVKDLRPNPYRNLKLYPIPEKKVNDLVASMRKTKPWKNLECRKVKDIYEIPYGHARLEALKKSGIEEVEIEVHEISDQEMRRKMVDENLVTDRYDSNVLRESVRIIRDALKEELNDEKSVFYSYKIPKAKKGGQGGYNQITADDIAWDLGPPWDDRKSGKMKLINIALNELREIDAKNIDEEDFADMPTASHSESLISATRDVFKEKPKNDLERKKRKQATKKVARGLASGQIKRKDAKAELRAEMTGQRRKERAESKITTDQEKLQSEFNEIMKEAEMLEHRIIKFTSSIRVAFKYKPKGLTAFVHAYDLMGLVKGLKSLWDLMKGKEQKLIENK